PLAWRALAWRAPARCVPARRASAEGSPFGTWVVAARRYCPRPMHLPAIDLRPGALIDFEGRMATVVWWNILRNDRRQFVQMRIRDLETGRLKELKENGDTRFEVLEKEE